MAKYAYYEEFAKYFDLQASADKKKINTKIRFLKHAFKKAKIPVKKVLELACGAGRFTIPLAKNYEITATDLSNKYLDLAKKKAKKTKLDIKFLRKDMRKIKYKEKFDAVFCIEAVYYMMTKKQLLALFRAVNAALKKGGVFAFDIPNWKWRRKNLKKTDMLLYKKGDIIFYSGIYLTYDWKKKIHTHNAFLFALDKGKIKTGFDKHTLRMWYPNELKSALKKAGFSKVELVDMSNLKKFKLSSPRLSIIAVK